MNKEQFQVAWLGAFVMSVNLIFIPWVEPERDYSQNSLKLHADKSVVYNSHPYYACIAFPTNNYCRPDLTRLGIQSFLILMIFTLWFYSSRDSNKS